jgi:hypothetical protein
MICLLFIYLFPSAETASATPRASSEHMYRSSTPSIPPGQIADHPVLLARLAPVPTGEAETDYFLFPIKPHLELAFRLVRITRGTPSAFYLSRLRTFRVHRLTGSHW